MAELESQGEGEKFHVFSEGKVICIKIMRLIWEIELEMLDVRRSWIDSFKIFEEMWFWILDSAKLLFKPKGRINSFSKL